MERRQDGVDLLEVDAIGDGLLAVFARPASALGMTAVRYPDALTAADVREVNPKLRKAIEDEGRLPRLEGDWWQHSLTLRTESEPSAISLLRISRDRPPQASNQWLRSRISPSNARVVCQLRIVMDL